MNISDYADGQKLQELQDKFAASTGTVAVVLNPSGSPITMESYPVEMGVDHDSLERGDILFRAGAMTEKMDIRLDGELIGYVEIGQLNVSRQEDALKKIASAAGKDTEEFITSLQELPEKPKKQMQCALEMFAEMVEVLSSDGKKQAVTTEEMIPQVEHLTTAIREIAQSAKKLEGIAFKQNILALNASIEAARAGDIGKGFAVVAQEMGNMTKNSSEIYGGIEDKVKELEDVVNQLNMIREK